MGGNNLTWAGNARKAHCKLVQKLSAAQQSVPQWPRKAPFAGFAGRGRCCCSRASWCAMCAATSCRYGQWALAAVLICHATSSARHHDSAWRLPGVRRTLLALKGGHHLLAVLTPWHPVHLALQGFVEETAEYQGGTQTHFHRRTVRATPLGEKSFAKREAPQLLEATLAYLGCLQRLLQVPNGQRAQGPGGGIRAFTVLGGRPAGWTVEHRQGGGF